MDLEWLSSGQGVETGKWSSSWSWNQEEKFVAEWENAGPRGKAAIRAVEVCQKESLLSKAYNIYIYALRLPLYMLSQPVEPVRWSTVALITDDQFAQAESSLPGHEVQKTYKSFLIRLNLVDPKQLVLIECHFELVCQRFVTLAHHPAPFITGVTLKLVRPHVSNLKYGLIVRHIIDEQSPLYNMDAETMRSQDVSFLATVSALEKSSMQPVFSEMEYAVADGDIVWDHQFVDQVKMDDSGRMVFDFKAFNKIRPMENTGGCAQ